MSGKKSPNLRLVTEGSGDGSGVSSIARPFQILSLGELSGTEAEKIQKLVNGVAPNAAILGIALTPRSWDVRPVVVVNGETGPSLIRFLGPEVTLSLGTSSRMQTLLERVSKSREFHTRILGWGVLDGQLWYRRELVDRTLAETMFETPNMALTDVTQCAKGLVAELRRWHAHNLVHGHLTAENVYINPSGKVALIDPGIAAAVVQASRWLQVDAFPPGYAFNSFAPELRSSDSITPASDIYGLGLIFELFVFHIEAQLQRNVKQTADLLATADRSYILSAMKGLAERMCHPDPTRRPALHEVATFLKTSFPTYRTDVSREQRTPTREEKQSEKSSHTERVVPPTPPVAAPISAPSTKQYTGPTPPHIAQPSPQPVSAPHMPVGSELWPTVEASERRSIRPQTVSIILSLALIGLIALNFSSLSAGVRNFFSGGQAANVYSNEDLKAMWSSHRPSQMREVVLAAIDAQHPNALAENLIVESAMTGDELSNIVDVGLIRVAFDRRWEMELEPQDRRTAIALAAATSKLLPDLSTLGPVNFEELHPGVILAFAAAAGDQAEQTVLAQIPAAVLVDLPVPYKPAFRAILQNASGLTVGSFPVRSLARFGTRGIDSPDQLLRFVAEDPDFRVLALALLFSEDDLQAAKVLDTLLLDTGAQLKLPVLEWARGAGLTQWNEVDPKDQLLVLAGVAPSKMIDPLHLRTLFEHPAVSVRKYAIEQVAHLKFRHPAAAVVLKYVHREPNRLTPKQTKDLISILAEPDGIAGAKIEQWLNSGQTRPMLDLAELMLLSTARQSTATTLDRELSRFLRRNGWQPGKQVLVRLASHPDEVTRMFAYSKIYDNSDTTWALETLRAAAKRESREDFKKQLQTMVDDLKAATGK